MSNAPLTSDRVCLQAVRLALLLILVISVSGCRKVADNRQAEALMNQANLLMKRDTKITQQWVDLFVKVFTKQNLAQFPANRDFLRSGAAQITKLIDESSSLNNSAADKYEQAARLTSNDQDRKGMVAFASAFRKTAELNELFKSQVQTVSDETLVNEKMLNETFSRSADLIEQKRRESELDFEEGKRLLSLSKKS